MRMRARIKRLALMAVACLCLCACAAKPQPHTAAIWYKTGGATVPMSISNVTTIKEYKVNGSLYQVVVYEEDALTPVVFTHFEIVRYAYGEGVELQRFADEVYHTYDPFLQAIKSEERKGFIHEKYLQYFGRAPSEEEFNEALEKLIQKVQLADLDVRLQHAPEAVIYRINTLRTEPLGAQGVARVKRMLESGKSAEETIKEFL